jgi:hypothetical protein
MREHAATRTLVKSAPELWLTCSEESLLGRHLDQFGEIRITRLEPESTVAWEGDAASGTVRIEPSGWGTKVTLTAVAKEIAGEPAVADEVAGEPAVADDALDEVAGAIDVELITALSPTPSESVAPELHEPVAPARPVEVGEQPAVEEASVAGGFWSRLLALLLGADSDAGHASPETPYPSAFEPPPAPDETVDAPPTALDAPETPEPPGLTPADQTPGPAPEFDLDGALTAALESLGSAHHRPYSRS